MIRLKTDRCVSEGKIARGLDICTENGWITDLAESSSGGEEIDLRGLYACPGLIDIHVHGGGGFDVMDATVDAIESISIHKLKEGVTSFCPTTVTASPEKTLAAVENIRKAYESGVPGARIIGAFLEGPYISRQYKGAHPEECIRRIDLKEIEDLIEKGGGAIKSFAIAPELPGALEAIKLLKSKGVNIRLGHSAATSEETLAGIDAGGSIAIHTFNAMSPFSHRAPGMAGAVLGSGIYAELICDFIHVSPQAVKVLYKCKSDGKLILVTDCMEAGGMPDGLYDLGEMKVEVRGGIAKTESGSLAGSTLTILKAVQNMHAGLGMPLPEALGCASEIPARAMGISTEVGKIGKGMRADIIALDDELNLRFAMVSGEVKIPLE
ncbi:MAG: N-acetylglucosamine-6-phosphate deacetylase [Clostridiales bacterium]|jgi:N-acetylglucosamine-6-phosphate deacetylase|nr:N-acetylglucosamine-6-phosphate deacetylase [Clostridiales bacterium]